MDNRMLERIVVIILLLLNLALAAVVLTDRAETRRSNAEITARVIDVLAENGIAATDKVVTVREAPKRCTLTRSVQKETELIRGMVGRAAPEDQGGSIMFYRGDKGQAVVRGSGEVSVLFTSGGAPLRFGPERTVRRMLSRAGIDAELTKTVQEGPSPYVEVCCRWNGCPVYNAALHVDYDATGLYMANGIRVFDSLAREDGAGLMNSVSALLRFVELAKSEGIICSRLVSIEPGYLQSVVVLGESTLTPVWRIETDTGVLFINAETGAAESLGA